MRTADKFIITIARIVGVPTTFRIRALLLGEAILFRTHYADELYRVRWCYLSIPRVGWWDTQTIIPATTGKATPLVLQSIEPEIVTYASDLTVPTARLLSAILLWLA